MEDFLGLEKKITNETFEKIISFYLSVWVTACMCICVPHACSAQRGQKWALYPLELELWDSYEVPCGGRKSNPGPLEKPSALLSPEPSEKF